MPLTESTPILFPTQKKNTILSKCKSFLSKFIGVVLVLCLVLDYSIQSQLLQYFYDRVTPEFQNYYLLCYVANGTCVLYGVAWLLCAAWERRTVLRKLKGRRRDLKMRDKVLETPDNGRFEQDEEHSVLDDSDGENFNSPPGVSIPHSDDLLRKWKWWTHDDIPELAANPSPRLSFTLHAKPTLAQRFNSLATWKKTFIVAFFLAPMQIFSAWLWYFSLDLIPVSLNMALYQSSVVFVFLLGFFILRERMDFFKLTILTTIVTGVVLMFLGGSQDDKHKVYDRPMLGCACVVVSALLVSMYTVLYTKFMPSTTTLSNFFLFQFFLGVVILVFCWPPIVLFHLVGLEPIPFSQFGLGHLGIVLGASFCTFLYSVLMAGALTITGSAVYVTVASLLVIPVSNVVDWWWHEASFRTITIIGIILILIGSILQNVIQILHLEWCGWDLTGCLRGIRQKRAQILTSKREFGVLEEGIFSL